MPYVMMLFLGLPQGVESQDSEQFFRKVLGPSDGSSFGVIKPILEGSKGELVSTALPQRALLPGVYKRNHYTFESRKYICRTTGNILVQK